MENKQKIRKVLLDIRKNIQQTEKASYDKEIVQRVFNYIEQLKPQSVGVYFPIRHEPDLSELYDRLAPIIALAVPITKNKEEPLKYVSWKPGDILIKGPYNIDIPQHCVEVDLPDVIIIPCVGFTMTRYRLGYGGGFFDRTLATHKTITTIGVAYNCLQTEFNAEQNDIPLDCIITESKIVI